MKTLRFRHLSVIAMAVLLFIVSVLFLLRPLGDYDFFWHLKTGEWIWQHHGLPEKDPFSFTSPSPPGLHAKFILTSYWLSQIIYYAWYAFGGLAGLFALRFILAGLLMYLLYRRDYGNTVLYSALLLISLIFIYGGYPFERPHVFSFLFFAALMLILEKIRHGSGQKGILVLLPLLMMLWSNMHGGVAIGQLVIAFYLFFESIKFLSPALQPMDTSRYRTLMIAGLVSLACSMMNPNTYYPLMETLHLQDLRMQNIAIYEYHSTFWFFTKLRDYRMLLYWFLLLLTGTGLLLKKGRQDITETFFLVILGIASFTTVRLVPFFIIAAAPATSRMLSGEKALQWLRPVAVLVALTAVAVFGKTELGNIQAVRSGQLIDRYMPEKAVDFIIRSNIQGRAFNSQMWGGYLIWRLGPERQVFIDGRYLNENAFDAWNSITNAYDADMLGTGKPYWKAALDLTRVNWILVTPFDKCGSIPLVEKALMRDDEWQPVYIDMLAVIFLRNTPENASILKTYGIPKDRFRLMLDETLRALMATRS